MLQRWLCIISVLLFEVIGYAQEEWPHHSNDWGDELFQARVLGLYDWIGSGPGRVTIFEYRIIQQNGLLTREAMPFYRISTVNRDLESFPPRDAIDPDITFFAPPNDWTDREYLISYLSNNETISEGFFEDEIDEDAGPDTYFLMGNIYFLQNRYTEAIEYYEKAIEKFSRFRYAYKNMAFAYFRLGDCDNALATAKSAIQLGALSAHIKGVEGYCALQQGNYQSAADAIAFARMLDPENETWLGLQIEALIQLGMYPQAQILLDGRMDNPGYVSKNLGHQIEIFRGEKNQEELFAALEIKKRSGTLTGAELTELIGIKITSGVSYLVSDDELSDYLERTRPSLEELANILEVKTNSEGWAAALSFSNDVLDSLSFDLTPSEKLDLALLQARVASETDQFESALVRLEPVLSAYPMHCDALLLSAEIHSRQGQNELADIYLSRAEHSSVECLNGTLDRRAKIVFDRGDYARSLNMYERNARQKLIDGIIEKGRHAHMIAVLADLVQLGSE